MEIHRRALQKKNKIEIEYSNNNTFRVYYRYRNKLQKSAEGC